MNGKTLEASYTVEASLVMSITLFFIAALLNGLFQIHSRVTGRFALQETLERHVFWEENPAGAGKTDPGILTEEGLSDLRQFFRCQDASMEIERGGERIDGWVKAGTETEISVRQYDPEARLRLLTAFGL